MAWDLSLLVLGLGAGEDILSGPSGGDDTNTVSRFYPSVAWVPQNS